jgi:hypothetical protein
VQQAVCSSCTGAAEKANCRQFDAVAACLQDGARLEKERQRAADRVQQLQSKLSAMRAQQDTLRHRCQQNTDGKCMLLLYACRMGFV